MAATTATSSCKSTTFYRLSAPKPPQSYKFSPLAKQVVYSYRCSSSSLGITQPQSSSPWPLISTRSVSSPESAVVEEAEDENGATTSDDEMSLDSGSLPPLTGGCKACGREEIERGCNGEGRIQGGIATVPGFGWWPIKAYRPCPAYVASGGRYRRSGQSMDEVVSGRGIRDVALGGNNDRAQSSKNKEGPKKIKI